MTENARLAASPHVSSGVGVSVLVAYASAHGSTKGIAERIGAGIREHGNRVDVRPVAEIDDSGPYDAVVLGSAVYNQRWLAEADEFARQRLAALAGRPVWLFSVGTFGDRKRLIGPLMKREPRNIRELARAAAARDYRVFGGVVERSQWPFASRLLYHAFGGRLGDHRDWREIDAWAAAMARALDAGVAAETTMARL